MLRGRISVLLLLLIIIASGCGFEPAKRYGGRSSGYNTPTPLPTRSAANPNLVREQIPSYFKVNFSGPYWVQLDRLDLNNTTIVVGVDPSRSGGRLEAEIEAHRSSIDYPPDGNFLDSGSIESPVLGQVLWSWGRYKTDDLMMDQLALFARHPRDGVLLIGRSEFPSAGEDIEPKLGELLGIVEKVGPNL